MNGKGISDGLQVRNVVPKFGGGPNRHTLPGSRHPNPVITPNAPCPRRTQTSKPPPTSSPQSNTAVWKKRMRFQLASISLAFSLAFGSPVVQQRTSPRPLVIWHGLGDSAHSEGMDNFVDLIKGIHPGIFVHSVYINENQDEDKKAGFVSTLVGTGLSRWAGCADNPPYSFGTIPSSGIWITTSHLCMIN